MNKAIIISIVIFVVIFSAIYGCSNKKDGEKIEINPEIFLESIATRFPGDLFFRKEN